MNHIDSSTLRCLESGNVWRERFGNSHERWLREQVAPDLRAWGFNTIGWTQEVAVRRPWNEPNHTMHRHVTKPDRVDREGMTCVFPPMSLVGITVRGT